MKLLLVGNEGGSHIGESFRRAALTMDAKVQYCSVAHAFAGPRILRAISWRLRDRKPPRLTSFSREVEDAARAFRPDLLLATGTAPITAETLRRIRARGVITANYLTDDPWNPSFKSEWLLRSIAGYDLVFSPRRANLRDLRALGCSRPEYLPFAYDPELFHPEPARETTHDVIFAGAADRDRVPFIAALLKHGVRVGLFGESWKRYPETREADGGWLPPAQLRQAVAASRVGLCLVRRANRDGHTMRTFELPAMKSCMLVEDTTEHREILGDTVAYFANAAQMLERLDALLADPERQRASAAAAHQRITGAPNTYRDRLLAILQRAGLTPPTRA